MLKRVGLMAGILVSFTSAAQALTCTPLKVLGSGLTAINKSISPPSALITGNNWNSDFIVPSGVRYREYVATVRTEKNGQYDLKMVLKYSDESMKTVFEQAARPLGVNDSFSMTGKPQSARKQPYQVNVLTGGTAVTGNSVTVKASGCR
ncbi:hypothetical protein [Candidatus Cyanaurora vandensis]|uniref:hypothetical protein n=1 Tax=Candidatus Cyanaurora vandensis TaxID=2714958 RepID=UPI00257F7E25|nr:hypothetical protein [Candidatus Cyanaurora vandensis]